MKTCSRLHSCLAVLPSLHRTKQIKSRLVCCYCWSFCCVISKEILVHEFLILSMEDWYFQRSRSILLGRTHQSTAKRYAGWVQTAAKFVRISRKYYHRTAPMNLTLLDCSLPKWQPQVNVDVAEKSNVNEKENNDHPIASNWNTTLVDTIRIRSTSPWMKCSVLC